MAVQGESDDFLQQAGNIWAMLDGMAQEDPTAYRKFIEKQQKEAQEYMKFKTAKPEPCMCVKSTIISSKPNRLVYLNICAWVRVSRPENDEQPIPVFGADLENSEDYSTVSIAFHPDMLSKYGRTARNRDEQTALIQLAIKYVEDQHNLRISDSFRILPDEDCYGDKEGVIQSLMSKLAQKNNNTEEMEETMKKLKKDFQPMASMNCDSLLSEVNKINNDSLDNNDQIITDIKLPNQSAPVNKNLIEEIKPDPIEPEYRLEYLNSSHENDSSRILIWIKLENVYSVKDCQLDITSTELTLEALHGLYKLYIRLPERVEEERVSAKFSKKTSTLTVTLPVVK